MEDFFRPDRIVNSIKYDLITIDEYYTYMTKNVSLNNILGFISIYRNNKTKYLYSDEHILEKIKDPEYMYIHFLLNDDIYKQNKNKDDIQKVEYSNISTYSRKLIDMMCVSQKKITKRRLMILSHNLDQLKVWKTISHNMIYDILKADWISGIAYLYKKDIIKTYDIVTRTVFHYKSSSKYSKRMLRQYSFILYVLKDKIDITHHFILSEICPGIFRKPPVKDQIYNLSDAKLAHMLGYNIYTSIPSKAFMKKRINMLIKDGPDKYYKTLTNKTKQQYEYIKQKGIKIGNKKDTLFEDLENYSEFDRLHVYSYIGTDKYLHIFTMPELVNMTKKRIYRNYYTNTDLEILYVSKILSLVSISKNYILKSLPLRQLYDEYLYTSIDYTKNYIYCELDVQNYDPFKNPCKLHLKYTPPSS